MWGTANSRDPHRLFDMSKKEPRHETTRTDGGNLDPKAKRDDCQPCVWFLSGQMALGEPVRHVAVNSSPFFIGRGPTLNLCLPFRCVSNVHAELIDARGSLLFRDLGSTNGSFVNGKRVIDTVQLRDEDILQIAEVALRVQRHVGRMSSETAHEDVCSQAMALVQFDQLMSQKSVEPYYQPIVRLSDSETVAFEVLGRSRVRGLETPKAMFQAAARLNLEIELSRMFRWKGIQISASFPDPPWVYVNTHPNEIGDPGLSASIKAIRELTSTQPITLEIHEAAATSSSRMKEIRAMLDDYDIGLAYDDFGAGQARLVELIDVRPDCIKFDMTLIRGIDLAPASRQNMVASLVKMVRDLEVTALAEGVETQDESTVCQQLGFDMAQGFYFGVPLPAGSSGYGE